MNDMRLLQIILAPWVTEKTARIGADGQYAFKVALDATKPEIKEAAEKLFNVSVDSVRIVNVKAKKRRSGKQLGYHKRWKKAYITLTEGHQIDLGANA